MATKKIALPPAPPSDCDSVSESSDETKRRGRLRAADVEGDELGAAEMSRRVAESLKRYRRLLNLSLDELAAKSGVSRAALSQIEGSKTNPTLSVLWKIAVGLGVPFQALLELPDEFSPKVLRAGSGTVLRSADDRFESRLLSPGGATPGIELYELRLAPRCIHKSDAHGRGTTETLVVLKGAIRMVVGEHEHELATGDTIFFRADVEHAYENRASHESRCLNVIEYARLS